MPTAEVYKIGNDGSRMYAGYARFDNEGNYQGSRGGYGSRQNPRNGAEGRGGNTSSARLNTGLRNQGNNARTGASMMQTAINQVGQAQARRLRNRRR